MSSLSNKLFNYDIYSGMKDSNSTETTQHIVPCEKDSNSLFHTMAASNLNTLLYICSPKCDFFLSVIFVKSAILLNQ